MVKMQSLQNVYIKTVNERKKKPVKVKIYEGKSISKLQMDIELKQTRVLI
jgi:hypothetical protein